MTVVTWKRHKSRLSKLMEAPGGISVGKALRDAKTLLEPLQPDCVAAVDARILELEKATLHVAPEDQLDRLDVVYHHALGILDAAGPFDLEDVCTTAYSLCELCDRSKTLERCDWRAVGVHVRSLRLLRQLPLEQKDARREVLDGLGRVLARTPRPAA